MHYCRPAWYLYTTVLMKVPPLVLFTLDEVRYALPLPAVERIVRAVEMVGLPGAPDVVCGVIDIEGTVTPVVNIRKRFGLRDRMISPSDQMVIAHAKKHRVVLVVDSVIGVSDDANVDAAGATDLFREVRYVQGVLKVGEDLVLIHDLDAFLSVEEERHLDDALENLS